MGRVLAIISEYNPFHNGHKLHLEKSLELSDADYVIAIMSGNFAQRGEPTIVDKFKRAQIALNSGIDMVIELPTIYATSSAETFAMGAMKVVKELGIVDYISFGSECGDAIKLKQLAELLLDEPESFKTSLKRELSKGLSYPQALNKATSIYFSDPNISDILRAPNNVLAIEYLKAIKRLNISASPIIIKRDYGVADDIKKITKGITSGTNVRNLIFNNAKYNFTVPFESFEILEQALKEHKALNGLKPFEDILLYKIRDLSISVLKDFAEVTEGLENKIKKAAYMSTNLEELIDNIKSKRYTEAKIRRILLHILLNITEEDVKAALNSKPYIRVLGCTEKGKELLKELGKDKNKLICTSVHSFVSELISNNEQNISNQDVYNCFMKDIYATNIYNIGIKEVGNTDFTNSLL